MALYVYIVTSRANTTLYTGVTDDLERRLYQHRHNIVPGFSSRHRIDKLVYYEYIPDVAAAEARMEEIRNWPRRQKVALIVRENPEWRDLAKEWVS